MLQEMSSQWFELKWLLDLKKHILMAAFDSVVLPTY